ncbi:MULTISPECIES: ABC transporter ATP-binding protein [Shouchella]|uniref:ABC transporter ATP-binding protein n=2 Tax=Shouchella TaxID=2893057 RepID=A0ABY7W304_9BACI|nr:MULTISPECIES: ABC transporter ATP-binding protein [Shouchella]MED4130609.1 ABC transporter ATP-binding protein [Shouchella miscanthi]WDF03337.1 ABC transporter ATP-binding protein [Shouchella hunanensis]GAF24189.1 ferric iron ABC transporter, ATP-binding protein [Bacillus sp. JCM 19047]
MSVAIHIENVVKKYENQTVIDGLSLEIKKGELFTLLGPSGCGKTTLLRMIIGFNSIEGGAIKLDDEVINNIPVNKRKMGMVFQNYAIFPHMTVAENIAFGLKAQHQDKSSMKSRIEEMMKVVRIEEHQAKKPDKLSGGQQQRVALARALVINPKVLLMDEPLSNLDAKLRVEMRNAIKDIQQEVGITTVYVTHDQEEALAISDRIAVMNKGVIQQIDKPETIYLRPRTLFVAQFIGTSNVIKATVEKVGDDSYLVFNEQYKEKLTTLSDAAKNGQEVLVSVRPQEFVVTSDVNTIAGTVNKTMFLGINTHYFVTLTTGETVEVVQNIEDHAIIPEGTTVQVKVKPALINVFDSSTEETLIKAGG